MNQLTLFRILSYILLPIGAFFGLMSTIFLLTAMANPALLLIVFLFFCMAVYAFTSFSFLTKGIMGGRTCKASLKDWIKVNAYVCVCIATLFVLNSVSLLMMNPVTLRQTVSQLLEAQPNLPSGYSIDFFLKMIKGVSGFMLFTGIVLLVHIFINFKLLKRYNHLFSSSDNAE